MLVDHQLRKGFCVLVAVAKLCVLFDSNVKFSRVFLDWVAGIFVGRVILYLLSLSSSAGDSKLALSGVGSGRGVGSGLVVVSGLGSGGDDRSQ